MSTVRPPPTSSVNAHLDQPDAAWRGFSPGPWQDQIDVRDFIQRNYAPYEGAADFLAGPTPRTTGIWDRLTVMFPTERERGVYDVDAQTPSTITAHEPGYIDKAAEIIVGLQTDAPLRRAIMPYGGRRMVEDALKTYGYRLTRGSRRSSRTTARRTTPACSMSIRRQSERPGMRRSSPVCPTRTAVAGSLATTVGLRFTAWTG